MSMDLKVIECESNNLLDHPKWDFITYINVNITNGNMDMWNHIRKHVKDSNIFEEENGNDLLTWKSFVFYKDDLKEILENYSDTYSTLKLELLYLIDKIQFDYIVLQPF